MRLVPTGSGESLGKSVQQTLQLRFAFVAQHTGGVDLVNQVGMIGAGVFGFLINLPSVSYIEHGSFLTANHGHAALMGVFGMLAIALALALAITAAVRMLVGGPDD